MTVTEIMGLLGGLALFLYGMQMMSQGLESAAGNKMKQIFAAWLDNGHNNLEDENTCILKIELTQGVLFSHGTKYEIDFTK